MPSKAIPAMRSALLRDAAPVFTVAGYSGLGPHPAPEVGPGLQSSLLSPHPSSQVSPGVIANPFAAGISHRNSLESISSIDRELSPEGPGKVRGTCSRQPQGQGARGRWCLTGLLCSQEKEPPGQTLHWGPEATEATVSVVALPSPIRALERGAHRLWGAG